MEQRPLRLGDIVDDYCPRERRITNHAIVAIVDNTIRQTRCSTCDADHVYKEARIPRRRKADAADEAPAQLVASSGASLAEEDAATEEPLTAVEVELEAADPEFDDETPPEVAGNDEPVALSAAAESGEARREKPSGDEAEPVRDDAPDGWLAHRRLIRATLPRVEGETPTRPIPEFTMHQRQSRGSHMFRGGHGGNGQGGQDHGNPRGGFRQGPGGNGSGPGQGNGRGRNRSGRRHKRPR